MDTNELIYETETDSRDIKNKRLVTKGRGVRGGTNKEFGISRYKIQTTIYKTDKQQVFTV